MTFAIIRLTRLYPLIVLGIFCGFLSKLFSLHFNNIDVLLRALPFALVLVPYSGMYGPNRDIFPLDPPIWSLMFEIWANFIYAFTVVRSAKMLRPMIIGAIFLGGAALIACGIAGDGLTGGHSIATFWTGVARVAFAFSTGIALNWIITPARAYFTPCRSGISPHAGPTFHVMPVQVFTACRSKISRQAGQDFTENQAGSF